jgi:hypothetical protein
MKTKAYTIRKHPVNFPFSMYIFLDDVVGCGEKPNATKFDEKRIYIFINGEYICMRVFRRKSKRHRPVIMAERN